jgi:hypothetical protein
MLMEEIELVPGGSDGTDLIGSDGTDSPLPDDAIIPGDEEAELQL